MGDFDWGSVDWPGDYRFCRQKVRRQLPTLSHGLRIHRYGSFGLLAVADCVLTICLGRVIIGQDLGMIEGQGRQVLLTKKFCPSGIVARQRGAFCLADKDG